MKPDQLAAARAKITAGILELIDAMIAEQQLASESLLTVKQAAEVLQCAEDTVRSAVHRENDPLPVCRVGSLLRFRRAEVLEWAGRQKPRAKATTQPAEPVKRIAPIGLRKAQRRVNGG
jgi:excisionase family DNA binding protein